MPSCRRAARGDSALPLSLTRPYARPIVRRRFECRQIHRDVAARNVLVNVDFTAKISDFGLSRSADATEGLYAQSKTKKRRLAVKWMAPETFVDRLFTEKSDVFSYGITMWECVQLGRKP